MATAAGAALRQCTVYWLALPLASLLVIEYTPGPDNLGEGLQILSGWNFATGDSAASLAIRVDSLSLPFLITALLMLLSATLLNTDLQAERLSSAQRAAGSLVLGAAACFLFVSANGLTVVHAALLFDVLVAIMWLNQRQPGMALGYLFLGVATITGLLLATTVADQEPFGGLFVLGIGLWLRLAIFPYISMTRSRDWPQDEQLAYYGITVLAGLYLTIRVVSQPLPVIIYVLVMGTMLLLGGRVWLLGQSWKRRQSELKNDSTYSSRLLMINLMVTGEALLVLLAAPLNIETAAAMAVGLGLSYVALWVTPALGPPKLGESAWSWPYLPAVTATLTLVGVHYSLGWPIRVAIFDTFLGNDGWPFLIALAVAEGLLLSSLYFYWLQLFDGSEKSLRKSVVGIVAMIPFLTPGLAFFTLSALTELDLWAAVATAGWGAAIYIVLVTGLAIAAGAISPAYFKTLPVQPKRQTEASPLAKILHGLAVSFGVVSRFVLRAQVILEGQHYMGWAVFVALVGTLIILLS